MNEFLTFDLGVFLTDSMILIFFCILILFHSLTLLILYHQSGRRSYVQRQEMLEIMYSPCQSCDCISICPADPLKPGEICPYHDDPPVSEGI